MTLDLAPLLKDWKPATSEVCARLFSDRQGVEQIQMRVDMGVLQMFPDGRPDGLGFRGCDSVLDFLTAALDAEELTTETEWDELEREYHQFNYRRLAYQSLAEEALADDNTEEGTELLMRAVRDLDHCLESLALMDEWLEDGAGSHAASIPAMKFHRARLESRRLAIEGLADEAIETAAQGARELREALENAGFDEPQCDADAGVRYLEQVAARLRDQFGLRRTLRERLEDAIEREDFGLAARLRDELDRRSRRTPPGSSPHAEECD
ncbi:MAG: UvrB/UvrC motif-containing protein [Phycisphaerales bacterium]|nr:UvrB/UvrC motif-containing protein [Phycisphaerales bacterium]